MKARLAGLLLAGLITAAIVFAQDGTTTDRGRRLFFDAGCYGCHIIGKAGTPIGPDLSQVGARLSHAYLARWLRDPESPRPAAHMPQLELSEEQIAALAAYLSSLR